LKVTEKEPAVSDSDFVQGIINESEPLIERLYKRHYPMILQLVLSNNGSEQDAKDVYQEAIIILCEKIQAGSFVLNSTLKTFIYAVSKRLWLKKLSHDVRRGAGGKESMNGHTSLNSVDYAETVAVDDELEAHLLREEYYQAMHRALFKLGEPCKTIIEDFYMHDQSMTDICEKFGYTNPDNAKTQKYKCMMRLKKFFFAEYSRDL